MKPACITAMLLLPFFPAFAQDFQPTRVGRVESKFDRSTDTTTLQCSLVELGEGAPSELLPLALGWRPTRASAGGLRVMDGLWLTVPRRFASRLHQRMKAHKPELNQPARPAALRLGL